MREVFENSEKRADISAVGINTAYDYSYMNVGTLMKRTLENKNNESLNENNGIKDKHSIKKLIKCRA